MTLEHTVLTALTVSLAHMTWQLLPASSQLDVAMLLRYGQGEALLG